MPLAQDQFRQKNRKIYESQFHLKEDTSKQLNADPKDLWQVKLICEDEKPVSGHDSEGDGEDNVICKKSYFKYGEDRRFDDDDTAVRKGCQQAKNVRFEEYSSEEYTTPENDYSDADEPEERRCCIETRGEGKRSREKAEHRMDEHCCHVCDFADCRKVKAKARGHDWDGRGKGAHVERLRSRAAKEEFEPVLRRTPPRGKVHSKGCSEYFAVRARPSYGVDCEEKMHRCGEWCNRYYQQDEPRSMCERPQVPPMHTLKYSKPYKHVHHVKKDKVPDMKWKKEKEEMYHAKPEWECCHHGKQKKKVLDSYEVLPAVDESLEERSDATYKASSYTKCPNVTVGEPQLDFGKDRNGDKFTDIYDRTSSWTLCDKMAGTSLKESLQYNVFPDRAVKRRSRRTRMNQTRSIKWKKALIQPVVGESQKEMVGVMVWGQSGPEFYSKKSSSKKGLIPYRKTRSFPDEPTKSYSMSFNLEPNNVFFSASDPGRKPRSELRAPEDDGKMEEKIANLDKNMEELVKSSKEKFLRTLTKEQFMDLPKAADKASPQPAEKTPAPVENAEEMKRRQSQHLMPHELLSSRAPRRMPAGEVVAFNVESKTTAEGLNEKAKQFRLGSPGQTDDFSSKLSELEKKFPPKQLDKETMDANLTVWGMKRPETERKEQREPPNPAGGEGDGNDFVLGLHIPLRRGSESEDHDRNHCELHSKKSDKDDKPKEEITDAAMEKLSEEMHRERRKKYYEAATAVTKEDKRQEKPKEAHTIPSKSPRKKSDAGDPQSPRSEAKSKPGAGDQEQILFDLFKNLVKDGCAISEKESENIQNILNDMRYEAEMNAGDITSSEIESKTSYETIQGTKEDASPRYSRYDEMSEKRARGDVAGRECPNQKGKHYDGEERQKTRWGSPDDKKGSKKGSVGGRLGEDCHSDVVSKKLPKLRTEKDDQSERKMWEKLSSKQRDLKSKKRHYNLEKIKLKMIREALPSMAAENEAAHLKQLKKYIHRFIDGVEHKISSSPEVRGGRQIKSKGARDTTSSNSSEVRVDAQKLIDLVSNPFKRITSDVTIDMARKLTDALIHENSSKGRKNLPGSSSKARKQTDASDGSSIPCPTTSGSGKFFKLGFIALYRELTFYTVFTYGFIVMCGVLFIVKKCK